jgi:hypothetical protein
MIYMIVVTKAPPEIYQTGIKRLTIASANVSGSAEEQAMEVMWRWSRRFPEKIHVKPNPKRWTKPLRYEFDVAVQGADIKVVVTHPYVMDLGGGDE